MAKYLLIDDTVSGKQGSVYLTLFGEVTELAGVQTVEITDSIQDRTLNTVGTLRTQTKANTIDGNGKMTLQYWAVSLFSKIVSNYKKTGKWEKFKLTVINEDKSTSIGKRTTEIYGCSLSGDLPISKLDATSEDALTVDIAFKYDDWKAITDFTKPVYVGVE